jgi:hypothetical protein
MVIQGIDTYWQDDKVIITLKEILQHLDNNKIPIKQIDVNEIKNIIINQNYDNERVSSADLNYPVILIKKNAKYKSILDGNHRALKAIKLNIRYIQAREIDIDSLLTPREYKYLFEYSIETRNLYRI